MRVSCNRVVGEVAYLRALSNRLIIQRSDLKYQKQYLNLQVQDFLASQNDTLSYIRGLGLSNDRSSVYAAPKRKLLRCIDVVRAVSRLRIWSRNWKRVTALVEGR